MDQGVIATFTAYYFPNNFSKAMKLTTGKNASTLTAFLKSYNIRNFIENIG